MRCAVALVWLASSVAHAQGVPAASSAIPTGMDVAFVDTLPRVDAARDELVVVALGAADERWGPLAASRLTARRIGEQRGRDSLHVFVDASAAQIHLAPSVLSALHGAIDREARVAAIRPRVDGSANVRVVIALARLRAITGDVRGLPWSP